MTLGRFYPSRFPSALELKLLTKEVRCRYYRRCSSAAEAFVNESQELHLVSLKMEKNSSFNKKTRE